jgi:hypothetical protein
VFNGARIAAFTAVTCTVLGCSVYRSSDRDDFDSKGASRAGISSFAFNDLCSVITLPKSLLRGVDRLTVNPSTSENADVSRCNYEAAGKPESLRALDCEIERGNSGFVDAAEVTDPNEEVTFSARASTAIGFLKCSVSFDGLADSHESKKSYDLMSREFAHFFMRLTSELSAHTSN